MLRNGGDGLSAVILNRFDIFNQWDQVMSSWQVFKDALAEPEIPAMQLALSRLVEDLRVALELYSIPDTPLAPDLLWTFIAYGAIGAFVCGVFCCGAVVFCYRRKPKEEPKGVQRGSEGIGKSLWQ